MMEREKKQLIEGLQKRGKTYEWAEWAVNQIDLAHYLRKYFVDELAELIIFYQKRLDLLV